MVKNLPINAGYIEAQFRSLGGEDPLEKEMATHSGILAWEIPWTEEPCRLQSLRATVAKNQTQLCVRAHTHTHTHTHTKSGKVNLKSNKQKLLELKV